MRRRGRWWRRAAAGGSALACILVGLYWITEAILIEAARFWWFVPIAVPALAATLAVFIAAAAWAARFARPGWPRALALAGAWVLADLARQFVATGFPWNLLGSVWEFPGRLGDVFIQPAAWISVHGLTLAHRAAGADAGAGLALARSPASRCWPPGRRSASSACDQPLPPAPGLHVVLVQGNVAEGQKWDRALRVAIFERYLRPHPGRHGPQPAPARRSWSGRRPRSPVLLNRIRRPAGSSCRRRDGAPALIGSVRFDRDDRPRNSLFALTDSGTIDGVYDKWHLVPFGEYQPAWFPARHPGRARRRISPAARGRARCGSPALPPVGPLICYEAIFPGQIVDPGNRPAWLVNITNDAWFGNSSGPRQHLAGGPHARGGGRAAAAARRQYRDHRGIRCARARIRADRTGCSRCPGGAIATRPPADTIRATRADHSVPAFIMRFRPGVAGAVEARAERRMNPEY